MHDDEQRSVGPTYWAVDAEADRAVAERVAGRSLSLASAPDDRLGVLEVCDGPEASPSLCRVRVARTLRQALGAGAHAPAAERLTLLEPFARLCETLGRAHEAGVTHGTLHAGAVALTEDDRPVILGWALASFADAGTPDAEAWAAYLAPYREAPDLRVLPDAGDALGSLSPETLSGEVGEREPAADVYALGAILYRILSGFPPFTFQTFDELAGKARRGGLPRPSHFAREAPIPLSALAARCLSPDPAERPGDADEVAGAVRAWQAAREAAEAARREREQVSLLLAGVREYGGDAGKNRLDEAIARTRSLLARLPDDEEVQALGAEAERMRADVRRIEREREEKARAEVESAWADAAEARAALTRLEAETARAKKTASEERTRLDGVRRDLTRARAEAASLERQLELMPHERDRAVAHALEAEQRRCRRLMLLVGVLGALLIALIAAIAFFASRGGEATERAVRPVEASRTQEGRPPRASRAETAPSHR